MSESDEKNQQSLNSLRERLGRKIPKDSNPSPRITSQNAGVTPPPNLSQLGKRKSVAPPPTFLDSEPPPGPFGGASKRPQQQHVKIVVDEQAMSTAHEHMSQRLLKQLSIAGVAAGLIGILIGSLAASQAHRRNDFNQVVRDGHTIYDALQGATQSVNEAKLLMDKALSAASPRDGGAPRLDTESIEALRKLPQPFPATAIVGRRYDRFSAETVDALFDYYQHVHQLWNDIDTLANDVLAEPKKKAIAASARGGSSGDLNFTGCVPNLSGNQLQCGLVFIDSADANGKMIVRSGGAGGGRADKTVYAGQNLTSNPSQYVIPINYEQSEGVLGSSQNAFAVYRQSLGKLSEKTSRLIELQGKLELELGNVASLQELWMP